MGKLEEAVKFWGDNVYSCETRLHLWRIEVFALFIYMAFACSLSYYFGGNPLIPLTVNTVVISCFNILYWRDRRRWKFHKALNRLTQNNKQWPWYYYAP